MNQLDFLVLTLTLLSIVTFGVWKTRGQGNLESYLLGDHRMKWSTIGLSVMATQASAITFISTQVKPMKVVWVLSRIILDYR